MLYFDRLLTTCLGEGTGILLPSIAAPIDGVVTPQSKYLDNTLVEYVIDNVTQWERGIGYFTASGTQFNRAGVFASTNSDALVSFTAGTKTLLVTPLAKTLGRLGIGRDRSCRSGRGASTAGGTDHITISPGICEEVILDTPGWHCVARPAGAKGFRGTITGGGGGGGGSVGHASFSGISASGGGGGGGSGTSRFAYRAEKIPFVWIYIGNGGLGGDGAIDATGTSGSSGERSFVCTHQDTTAQCVLAVSGAVAAGGGGIPTAGVAGTVSSDADAPLSQGPDCIRYDYFAGDAGEAGSSSGAADGVSQTLGTNPATTGGAGGGGVSASNTRRNGGSITGVDACDVPTNPGGASGGVDGSLGFEAGLYSLGGAGGSGAFNVGAAIPDGGQGVFGSGGGGGGGSTSSGSFASGAGGKGGPGRCYLIWT